MNEQMIENEGFQIEGLSEKEARQFKEVLGRFVASYKQKDADVADKAWLATQLKAELESLSQEQAEELATEAMNSIDQYDQNLASLNSACAKGQSKEQWFTSKVTEAATGVSVVDFGNYLQTVDTAVSAANAQMMRTVTTQSGGVSQCINLDGFIAEQYHVNQFNLQAALHKSGLVAEVCVPEQGQTYGLNSFDAVIKDGGSGKILHQYQFKFGSDAKATIELLKNGNYNNQRIVVPAEQVAEVAKAFPGKTVTAYMGGTDQVPFQTQGLTKQQVKELQLNTQQNGAVPNVDWNTFTTKELAINLGKNVGQAGLQAAVITAGFDLAAQAMSGEQIDGDRVIETALTAGVDTGIKAATAGAIKVGVEKGIISIIPKGTPIGILTQVACVGIENIKILMKVAKGDLTMTQATEQMGRTTTSMIFGIGAAAKGAAIGAAALSWIPIVGPIVGSLAGGMVGYMAGSKLGTGIYNAAKTVGTAAKTVFTKVCEGFKSAGRTIAGWFGR